MQASISVDTSKFDVGCAVYSAELKKTPREVVTEQSGLLMVDLGRNLPPKDPDKTKASIEAGVHKKYSILSTATVDNTFVLGGGGKAGHGDVLWVGSSSKSLFGIAKEADMTKASVEELRKLYYTLTKSAKQRVGQRGKQKVYIGQKITAKEATVRKLIADIQKRVGLLRASFCIGLSQVGAKQQPPSWVMRHIFSGQAKGDFTNGLNQQGRADFTIISNAAGCTSERATFFLQGALDRRGESMIARIGYLQRQAKEKAQFN